MLCTELMVAQTLCGSRTGSSGTVSLSESNPELDLGAVWGMVHPAMLFPCHTVLAHLLLHFMGTLKSLVSHELRVSKW